jgi:hypothetical protein
MLRRSFVGMLMGSCVAKPRASEPSVRAQSEPIAPPVAAEPEVATPARIAASALQERADALADRYGKRGFTVLVEPPFVVIGDEDAAAVRRHAEGTVRWAVERLERDYFAAHPASIIEVWLFGDDDGYRRWAKQLFDDEPDTPYGYYSPEHEALVMNIGTGGGTLVHEIVHPYMATNFPACPSWFNEGLGSLYEQCGDREGHIWGFTNWRLPALQEAIRARRVPPTKTLCDTGDRGFYDDDPGTNYAQARYLCMWLQEQRALVRYYHDFVAAAASDPSGFETLRAAVGEGDMERFDRDWRAWVLGLRFG